MILGACAYDTHFEDCTVRCAADMECPVGLACKAEGFCRTPGATEMCTAILETLPSCAGLAATCGPNADEDCCSTATPIPGGTFFRGYDVASDGMYPSTAYPATVSPFVLDRFEVTVGRFRKFVEAGMGTQQNPPVTSAGARSLNELPNQGGWDSAWELSLVADTTGLVTAVNCNAAYQAWTDAPGANEAKPMNCLTWYEAFAFCAWDGGFLPSESEWAYAAAGGSEQRAYPWSIPASSLTIDCSYANYYNGAEHCVNPPNGANGAVNRVGTTSPKGDGKYGQADLAGNAWEWTLDWYQSPYGNPCSDCAALTAASNRVAHGGCFNTAAPLLRGANRHSPAPDQRDRGGGGNGVRCARAPFMKARGA